MVSSSILVFIYVWLSLTSPLGCSGFFNGPSASLWMISTIFLMGTMTICSMSLVKVSEAATRTAQVKPVMRN
jgi:hypothetical protein